MIKLIKQRKGVTLIELIITLALTSIVIIAVINLFLFNNRIFNKSDALSQVQFDVRMASDMLAKNLRNVSVLSLTDNTLINKVGISELQSKYPTITSISFTIGSESSKFLVEYTLVGHDTNGENKYTLKSKILLNNITSAIPGDGNIIYYE